MLKIDTILVFTIAISDMDVAVALRDKDIPSVQQRILVTLILQSNIRLRNSI